MKTPIHFEKLFPYQKMGIEWLASKRHALLADEQRLGKTVQSIISSDAVPYHFNARILVICRAVALNQWAQEFSKWSSLDRFIEIRKGRKNHKNPKPNSVVIANYEIIPQVLTHLVGKFDLVIVDEAHYLKNPNAERTKTILGKSGLIHRSERMWLMTGTPTPNNASELWVILYTFGVTTLKLEEFIKKFCNTIETGYGAQILGTKTDAATISELKALLSPIMLRRTTSEVSIQLPTVFYSTQVVEAGPVDIDHAFAREIELYGREELLKLIESEIGVMNAIIGKYASSELIEVLKAQAKSISTLRRYTALQKVQPFVDIITEELECGAYQKVVIFCIHRAVIEELMKQLSKFKPVCVMGNTSDPAANIDFFQNNEDCRIFVGNISAAGTSISLTAANHIYFLEEAWTPGDNSQAAMRCGGINQPKPIFVKTILLSNSVDMKVHQTVNRKSEEQQKIYQKTDFEMLL